MSYRKGAIEIEYIIIIIITAVFVNFIQLDQHTQAITNWSTQLKADERNVFLFDTIQTTDVNGAVERTISPVRLNPGPSTPVSFWKKILEGPHLSEHNVLLENQ